jgi:hypothetical protein
LRALRFAGSASTLTNAVEEPVFAGLPFGFSFGFAFGLGALISIVVRLHFSSRRH